MWDIMFLVSWLGYATEPMAPPPKQPIELHLSKEGLPGKRLEIVSEDECVPFVLKPQPPQYVAPHADKEKPKYTDYYGKKVAISKTKVALSIYNRKGKRHK